MAEMFDWIFFCIVGVPLVLALVELFVPSLLESIISMDSSKTPRR